MAWSLTVLVTMLPPVELDKARVRPQSVGIGRRVFQALLDLDSIVGPDQLTHDHHVADGRVECLVASSLAIENIFANHLPVTGSEDGGSKDTVGVAEAVENESALGQQPATSGLMQPDGPDLLVGEASPVCRERKQASTRALARSQLRTSGQRTVVSMAVDSLIRHHLLRGMLPDILYFGWVMAAIQSDQHGVAVTHDISKLAKKVRSFVPAKVP
jgi:hypothetical protein